jgi:queuine tRNA-ribosyltransferase
VRNAAFTEDSSPLEAGCPCTLCTQFSRAYLNHLFRADEMLGPMLLTEHNLVFYQRLMQGIREAIRQNTLRDYAQPIVQGYQKMVEG